MQSSSISAANPAFLPGSKKIGENAPRPRAGGGKTASDDSAMLSRHTAAPADASVSAARDRAVADSLIAKILPGENGVGKLILRPFVKLPQPILEPTARGFDSKNVYNIATIRENGTTYMIYRAESDEETANENTGRFGLAWSADGARFERYPQPIVVPEHDYERGGVEDPRIVKAGDTYILTYTGFPGKAGYWDRTPKLCLATSKDLLHWEKKGPVFPQFSPTGNESKSGAILPEKIKSGPYKGRYVMYFGDSNIWMAHSKDLVHWTPAEKPVLTPRAGSFDGELVESGPPPIVTKDGILLIYNSAARDETGNLVYKAGAALFSKSDPSKLIARTDAPFLEPSAAWEKVGYVDEVVFAQGLNIHDGKANLYFGGGDHEIGLATMDPSKDREPATASPAAVKPWLETDGAFWKYLLPVMNHVSNPSVVRDKNTLYMLFRSHDGAGGQPDRIGLAFSENGLDWTPYPRPVISPDQPYEKNGVEDPRVTKIGDTFYATYGASSDEYGKSHVALAVSKNMMTWEKKGPILEIGDKNRWDGGNRKAAVIVPEKINGRYVMYYMGESQPFKTAIGIAYSDDLVHWEPSKDPVALPRGGSFDSMGIEPGPAPMVTKDGIILFYNGWDQSKTRKIGAILFSKDDPSKILDRAENPILEPTRDWEKSGVAPGEISANGLVDAGGWKMNLYYGASGSSIGLATAKKKEQ